MKEIKVRILEEYRDHTNPDRRYHLVDIETLEFRKGLSI